MVIVDTSVWVDAWRVGDARLDSWLAADLVLQHSLVTAELGMGSFRSVADRDRIVALLDSFEQARVEDSESFHAFVSQETLFGTGIGFADAHLLLTCKLNPDAKLVTRDKRLAGEAKRLAIEVVD